MPRRTVRARTANRLQGLALGALLALALVGCTKRAPDPAPDATPAPAPASTVPTYWAAVAPILDTHCTGCHSEGGIGPNALTTFAEVKARAGEIAYETKTKQMPPWLPDTKSCAALSQSRALSDTEIATLQSWAANDAPEGDQRDYHAPPPPPNPFGSLAKDPDRIAIPDTGYVPKRGRPDDYHCFVLDPKLDAPERVVGLKVTPGLPSVVHHVVLYEGGPCAFVKVQALDSAEPGPGFTCFGGIGVEPTVRKGDISKGELIDFDSQMIVGWAPGANSGKLPEGTAIKLAAGSKLVMQVHYSLENDVGKTDRTSVGLWFAKPDEPLKQAVWVPLFKYDFLVPKDARAEAHANIDLPLPLEIRGVAPHMHLRGQSIKVENVDDNQCLLDVPKWNFHHQEGYWLKEPVEMKKARLTCQWDNRATKQPYFKGKPRPSRELHWGEGTDDEMCLAFLYATL